MSTPRDRMSRMQHYASYVSFETSAIESDRAPISMDLEFTFRHHPNRPAARRESCLLPTRRPTTDFVLPEFTNLPSTSTSADDPTLEPELTSRAIRFVFPSLNGLGRSLPERVGEPRESMMRRSIELRSSCPIHCADDIWAEMPIPRGNEKEIQFAESFGGRVSAEWARVGARTNGMAIMLRLALSSLLK
jgi:hypothetical protein